MVTKSDLKSQGETMLEEKLLFYSFINMLLLAPMMAMDYQMFIHTFIIFTREKFLFFFTNL